jgi:hypothetical protein
MLNPTDDNSRNISVRADQFVALCTKGEPEAVKEAYYSEESKSDIIHYAGDRALRMAAKNGNFECVRFLIDICGANIHAESDSLDGLGPISLKDAPINHAIDNENVAMLDFLFSRHLGPLCNDYERFEVTEHFRAQMEAQIRLEKEWCEIN